MTCNNNFKFHICIIYIYIILPLCRKRRNVFIGSKMACKRMLIRALFLINSLSLGATQILFNSRINKNYTFIQGNTLQA